MLAIENNKKDAKQVIAPMTFAEIDARTLAKAYGETEVAVTTNTQPFGSYAAHATTLVGQYLPKGATEVQGAILTHFETVAYAGSEPGSTLLNKRFDKAESGWKKTSYTNNAVNCSFGSVGVDSPSMLASFLSEIQMNGEIGVLNEATAHAASGPEAQRRGSNFAYRGTRLFVMDLDDKVIHESDNYQSMHYSVDVVEEHIKQHGADFLEGVSYVIQRSASYGVLSENGVRKGGLHVFFFAKTTYHRDQFKSYCVNTFPALREGKCSKTGKVTSKTAVSSLVDVAMFHPVQIHYTAAPYFYANGERISDPIAHRVGVVTKRADGFDLPKGVDHYNIYVTNKAVEERANKEANLSRSNKLLGKKHSACSTKRLSDEELNAVLEKAAAAVMTQAKKSEYTTKACVQWLKDCIRDFAQKDPANSYENGRKAIFRTACVVLNGLLSEKEFIGLWAPAYVDARGYRGHDAQKAKTELAKSIKGALKVTAKSGFRSLPTEILEESVEILPTLTNAPTKYMPPIKLEQHTRMVFLECSLGTGKTSSILELVKGGKKVLFLVPLRTLASALTHRVTDARTKMEEAPAVDYQEVTGKMSGDGHFVVCINSLERVDMFETVDGERRYKQWDYVVIDEAQQVFNSVMGRTVKDSPKVSSTLKGILTNTKVVIAADAFLSEKTRDILKRSTGFSDAVIMDIKHHWVQPNREVLISKTKEDAILRVKDELRDGKRLYIATTSRAQVRVLAAELREEFPRLTILDYHSEIDQTRKADTIGGVRDDLGDVPTTWGRADVVIGSPTISSGVSFDTIGHFDSVHGIFDSVPGIGYTDLLQQLARVRSPRSLCMYVWISARQVKKETRRAVLAQHILALDKETEHAVGEFSSDSEGRPLLKPFNDEHFQMYLDVEIDSRQRGYRVKRSFFAYLRRAGVTVTHDVACDVEDKRALRKQLAERRAIITKEDVDFLAEQNIVDLELARVREPKNKVEAAENYITRATAHYGVGEMDKGLIEDDLKNNLNKKTKIWSARTLWKSGAEDAVCANDRHHLQSGFVAGGRNHAAKTKHVYVELVDIFLGHIGLDLGDVHQRCYSEANEARKRSAEETDAFAAAPAETVDISGVERGSTIGCIFSSSKNTEHSAPTEQVVTAAAHSWSQKDLAGHEYRIHEDGPCCTVQQHVENLRNALQAKKIDLDELLHGTGISIASNFDKDPNRTILGCLKALGLKTKSKQTSKGSVNNSRRRVYSVDVASIERMNHLSKNFVGTQLNIAHNVATSQMVTSADLITNGDAYLRDVTRNYFSPTNPSVPTVTVAAPVGPGNK